MIGWDRILWGIAMTDADGHEGIIGQPWSGESKWLSYVGEPTRALLFNTRADARSCCTAMHEKYAGRNDCCAKWRFRPVRVREIVEEING